MSNHVQSSPAPAYPFQWGESVLSTRSLSYLSTGDALGSPGLPSASLRAEVREPDPRTFSSTAHQSGPNDDSDDDLHMAAMRKAQTGTAQHSELPLNVINSPLFKLPREIRDRIYTFCLTADSRDQVEWPPISSFNKRHSLQPQLLRTCKTIHDAAAPLLYTENDFSFHHPSDANMFVRAIASPTYSRRITNLWLHIKAQDTRLWMPYLTSTDASRSLKADFPNLKKLIIRFRSNKWNHATSVQVNLRAWADDSRLDEVFDGLRHTYFPSAAPPKDRRSQNSRNRAVNPQEAQMANANPVDSNDDTHRAHESGNTSNAAELQDESRTHKARTTSLTVAPSIRLICSCRVHAPHFAALTGVSPPTDIEAVFERQIGFENDFPAQNTRPVEEGEDFRGFDVIDLRTREVDRLYEADVGSANIARTPFADREGILIALEIHCVDPAPDSLNGNGT